MTVPPADSPRPSAPPPLPTRPPLPPYVTVMPAGPSQGFPSDAERGVRRAATVAFASAMTEIVIGALGVVISLVWFSLPGLFVTTAITVVGFVELTGSRRMRRADPSAPRMLAVNQVALFLAIALYCAVQMTLASTSEAARMPVTDELLKRVMPDDPEFRQPFEQNLRGLLGNASLADAARIFYGIVVVLSIAFQGGMAWYYFTRRRVVEQLRGETRRA